MCQYVTACGTSVNCYETRTPDRLRRWLLTVLPFFGPTIILKVRKIAPAPGNLFDAARPG